MRAPLQLDVSADDVGAKYPLSYGVADLAAATLYVDSGYHAMGM